MPTVGDMGELPTTLPIFALPQVPFTLETLQIVLPTALTMAIVGLLASFLAASLVDEGDCLPWPPGRFCFLPFWFSVSGCGKCPWRRWWR